MTEKQSGTWVPNVILRRNQPHRLPKNERRALGSRVHARWKIKHTLLLSSCAFEMNNGYVWNVFQNGRRLVPAQLFIMSCFTRLYRFWCIINIVFKCCAIELTLNDCQKMTNCVIKISRYAKLVPRWFESECQWARFLYVIFVILFSGRTSIWTAIKDYR